MHSLSRVARFIFRGLLLLSLFTIPFGSKKFFAVLLPRFFDNAREFSSLFLYGADVLALLVILFAIFLFRTSLIKGFTGSRTLPLFLLFCAGSLFFAAQQGYALWVFGELLIAVLFSLSLAAALRTETIRFREVASAIGAAAVLQACVALFQFAYQKSIGLAVLGETIATSTTPGIARVVIEGARYLRSYGTLPHANILAGFLVFGLVALVYLFLTGAPEKKYSRVSVAIGTFLVLAGLVVSFSRSGWIVASIALFAILGYGVLRGDLRKRTLSLFLILAVSLAALWYFFGWAIAPRAGFTNGEASVDHRIYYNEIGLTLLREHPLGVGMGNEVVVADKEGLFAQKGLMQIWLAQPVHNIYILIASEVGIAGLFSFLIFLGILFYGIRIRHTQLVFGALFVGVFLAFGLVDHFPWDLHAGRLMFWSALGIMMGERV